MKGILKHPWFLMAEALIGVYLLESASLPPAVFDWKISGLLLLFHSGLTMLYLIWEIYFKEEK